MTTALFPISGTTVQWAATNVNGVQPISGPAMQRADIPYSAFESTFVEHMVGLPDYGSFTITLKVISQDSGQEALHDDYVAGTERAWEIELPNPEDATTSTNHKYGGSGKIRAVTPGFNEVDGHLEWDVEIVCTTAVTVTDAED